MGLNYAECKVLGIEHLHPSATRDRPAERGLLEPADGMNGLERRFCERLVIGQSRRLVRQWAREPVTFRLAGRTRYTPDFGVWPEPASDWRFTLVEVKGFMRDDASVKIKVAADLFPCFRWLLAYRDGRSWDVREVDRNGIGRRSIVVPWINGIV